MHLLKVEDDVIGRLPRSLRRPLGLEWYGQTAASVCWIASVFVYGIDGAGDLLQLCAASAWLLANISTALAARNDRHSN